MIVDIHAHFVPRGYLDAIREEGGPHGASLRVEPGGDVTIMVAGRPFGPITRHYWDTAARLADMDAAGVDVQVVSLQPPMLYWAPPETAAGLARLVNDEIVRAVKEADGRLQGLATLPLQDVPAAVAETERSVRELALRGVYIGTHVRGVDLDDPRFDPLWAKCQELDIPVFTHPIDVLGGARVSGYHLHNLIGNPTDTTVAAMRLIFGGVLDRFPRLQVCLDFARILHRRTGAPGKFVFAGFAPRANHLRRHFHVALHAQVPLQNERLVAAVRAGRDARGPRRQSVGLAVPVKGKKAARIAKPGARLLAVGNVHPAPADFLRRVGADRTAQGPGHQLSAEAMPEHRHTRVHRSADQPQHPGNPGQIVVDAHRAAHESESRKFAGGGRHRCTGIDLHQLPVERARFQVCGKIAWAFDRAVAEYGDRLHGRVQYGLRQVY